jgi:hypothetical protein
VDDIITVIMYKRFKVLLLTEKELEFKIQPTNSILCVCLISIYIFQEAAEAVSNLDAFKSKEKYEKCYKIFVYWTKDNFAGWKL